MGKPRFQEPVCRPIRNFFTDEVFHLVSVDGAFLAGREQYDQVAAICNQPLVYRMLFAKPLQGKPYAQEDAQRFLGWAQRGWEEGTHFVFLILQRDRTIVGAADIKSGDLASAEVGYWMSALHPGVMTNALLSLTQVAREAGYKELYARVKAENVKSAGVLERSGFECTETFRLDGAVYKRFVLRLQEGPAFGDDKKGGK